MTSERDKCGFSSFLPMSCRGRAEAFARRLHSRLRSLGSEDGNGSADESSWLGSHESSVAVSQPKHGSDELYLNFALLDSPGSPEEEIGETEFYKLINQDNLHLVPNDSCHCPKSNSKDKHGLINIGRSSSLDSDSDGPYFDTVANDELIQANGILESPYSSSNKDSDSDLELNISSTQELNREDSFASASDNVTPQQNSQSEDVSTLSLKDEESLSLDSNLSELPTANEELKLTDNISETSDSRPCTCECFEKNEDGPEYSCQNGNIESESQNTRDTETYVSTLSVEKDLTIECPNRTENEVIAIPTNKNNIEIQVNQDDDDDLDCPIPRVRRCSSLKTGKTPPDTPGRKKIVRFADVLGLDLADVRTFLDEIPKVPVSAYNDLVDADLSESSENSISRNIVRHDKVLVPLFQQPGGQPNFLDLVRENCVCLENALVEDPIELSISGTVRVRNLDFHKSVHIRYSLDSWKTFADLQAVYVNNSCDGFSDTFSFKLYANTLSLGQRLEFAVRFQCRGCQYWDNNKGANYCFQCLPSTNNSSYTPITGVDDHWGASFY